MAQPGGQAAARESLAAVAAAAAAGTWNHVETAPGPA